MVRNVGSVLTLLCGLFVSGPAVAQNQAPPPSRSDAASTAPIKSDSAGAAVDPKTYVIGAQDVLMIKVWREQDFTGPYTVRPDGKISMPLVGDVQASGLTPERLGEQLKQALANFIKSPDVTVSLQTVGSKKFYITGEVNRAGEYTLATPTKVFDALSNAWSTGARLPVRRADHGAVRPARPPLGHGRRVEFGRRRLHVSRVANALRIRVADGFEQTLGRVARSRSD